MRIFAVSIRDDRFIGRGPKNDVFKKVEDLRQLGAFHSHWSQSESDRAGGGVGRHYAVYRE